MPITFACGLYDRMLALQTGEIKPDGIDLDFLVMDNPREIFDRMSNRLEFDACEMSSSEFISRFAAKKLPFVALPVFASRVFRHGFIVVNRSFVTSAKELAGKRIGVPLYTQTAAIFIRGLMQHDLGIDLSEHRMGAGRDQRARRLRQSVGHAAAQAGQYHAEPERQVAQRPPRRPAKSMPSSARTCRTRSSAIPTWCGCFRTTGPARRTISAAPGFSRSCT